MEHKSQEFYFYVTGGTFILEPAVSNTMVIEVTSSNATLSLQNASVSYRACNDIIWCDNS